MDVVEPVAVDVVMEAPASSYCNDADRARAALEEALVAARAPRHTKKGPGAPADPRWSVSLGVSAQATATSGKSVDAVIVDDTGAVVARRTIADRAARSCLPLAKAVGAWASLVLDAELAREGVNLIAPHRKNRRKLKTQDGRPLRRYARRWIIERFFSWMQWKRRLLVRWEYYAENFLGFVQLAAMSILLRRI